MEGRSVFVFGLPHSAKCSTTHAQDPRFKKVKRPYTAEDVVSKRGTIRISYPSNVLAKKLWASLSEHFAKGEPSHTYGASVGCI